MPYFCGAQTTVPTITATALTGNIYACTGMYSVSPDIGQITVSGINLTTDITAAAPTGFEISLSADNGYGNTVILKQSGGRVTNAVVYVRLAATANAGVNTGNVMLNSGNTTAPVAVNGDAAVLPVVNPITSQTVTSGEATKAINFTGTTPTFTWTNDNSSIGLAASGTGNIASFKAINKGNTPVKATIAVTPQPNPGYAYISNELSNNVTIINTSTLQTVPNDISITDPNGVAVSPDGQSVYITSDEDGSVTAINTATNEIINTVGVGERAFGVVVSPDNRTVYVANYSSSSVTVVSPPSPHTVTIPLQPYGTNPQGIAITPDGSRLYVGCGLAYSLVIINTANNNIIGHLSFSDIQSSPYGVAVSPDGKTVYGTSTFLDAINVSGNTYTSTPLGVPATTAICISPDGSTAYICNENGDLVIGNVIVFNLLTNTITATIPIGYNPFGISITPDGHYVYVGNASSNTVSVINTTSNTVIATIPVGTLPMAFGNFIKGGNDCSGTPVTFTITVNPASGQNTSGDQPPVPPVIIPNTFTPNGDGINDVWNIKDIGNFPNCTVNVFNRYGEKVYSSIGYTVAWDGTYKGSPLPVGTYYYLIDLKNGIPLLSGYVAIIK